MSQDDESPEIEMTADEPTPVPAEVVQKQRRRRAANPTADEPIHTGEIAPRSMIIRSSPSMEIPKIEIAKIEISDEKTELAPPPIMEPEPVAAPPRRARAVTAGVRRRSMAPIFIGVGVAIAGVVVAVVLVGKSKPAATTTTPANSASDQHRLPLQAAAQFIGTTFDADAKAALVRAEAMATSSMLRAGILTDAQTLQDMAKDKDVVFKLEAGDTVEVIQVRDGTRTPMLRLPGDAAALDAPPVGKTKIVLRNGAPIVIATAEIAEQQGTSGQVVLGSPVDLEAIKKRVAGHAVEASLVGLGAPIVLAKTGTPGGETIKLPIENEAKLPLELDVVLAK
ncbi:MAG TPA: hypothetical protein VMZ53_24490 [Kofleriaceae bacterium]|nr:hypothetical protein [Kofleriaceae bacterium]